MIIHVELRQSQVHLLFIMHANVDSVHLHEEGAKYCKSHGDALYLFFRTKSILSNCCSIIPIAMMMDKN